METSGGTPRRRSKGNIDRASADAWPDLPPGGMLWERLAEVIRVRIVEGDVAEGCAVPGISEFRRRYQVSTQPVVRALRELQKRGYLELGTPDTHGFHANLARLPAVDGANLEPGQLVALYAGRSRQGPWFEVLAVKPDGQDVRVLVPEPGGETAVWKGALRGRSYPVSRAPGPASVKRRRLAAAGHLVAVDPVALAASVKAGAVVVRERARPAWHDDADQQDPALDGWPLLDGMDATEIAAVVKNLIAGRVLLPGARLPAQRTIADRRRSSRSAVRQAFLMLVGEGVLRQVGGLGYFVSAPAAAGRLGRPGRVTRQFVAVARYLLDLDGREVYGWQVIKATGLVASSVYNILERMRAGGWLIERREDQPSRPGMPVRCLYRLTEYGTVQARTLVAERR